MECKGELKEIKRIPYDKTVYKSNLTKATDIL